MHEIIYWNNLHNMYVKGTFLSLLDFKTDNIYTNRINSIYITHQHIRRRKISPDHIGWFVYQTHGNNQPLICNYFPPKPALQRNTHFSLSNHISLNFFEDYWNRMIFKLFITRCGNTDRLLLLNSTCSVLVVCLCNLYVFLVFI